MVGSMFEDWEKQRKRGDLHLYKEHRKGKPPVYLVVR